MPSAITSALIDELLDTIPAKQISFISMGGLRMTPRLRGAARGRFPGIRCYAARTCSQRMAASAPSRRCALSLYRALAERFKKAGAEIPAYLCMEPASIHENVFGAAPLRPATIGERLARS